MQDTFPTTYTKLTILGTLPGLSDWSTLCLTVSRSLFQWFRTTKSLPHTVRYPCRVWAIIDGFTNGFVRPYLLLLLHKGTKVDKPKEENRKQKKPSFYFSSSTATKNRVTIHRHRHKVPLPWAWNMLKKKDNGSEEKNPNDLRLYSSGNPSFRFVAIAFLLPDPRKPRSFSNQLK